MDAPAKLTLGLRVVGRRGDGYHLLDVEMVSLDLADTLVFAPGDGLTVVDRVVGGRGVGDVPAGEGNLVVQALARAGLRASVTLIKRIPAGAGLGGGSADAAAVLRWAGRTGRADALALGADVPFCVAGGRARVRGVGEVVDPLPFVERRFVLLLPPLSVATASVYRAYDELGDDRHPPGAGRGGGPDNDLEPAALAVAPAMALWRDALADATGRRPRLAGSGSTWFVEGTPEQVGLAGRRELTVAGQPGVLVEVRTTPATVVGPRRPGAQKDGPDRP